MQQYNNCGRCWGHSLRAKLSKSSFMPPVQDGCKLTVLLTLKICISGECIAQTDTQLDEECLFGDGLITQAIVDDLELPAEQLSCDEFIDYLQLLDLSPMAYCEKPSIRKTCCQTCRSILVFLSVSVSNRHFLKFLFYSQKSTTSFYAKTRILLSVQSWPISALTKSSS